MYTFLSGFGFWEGEGVTVTVMQYKYNRYR